MIPQAVHAFFQKLLNIAEDIFDAIFGDIDFTVLWNWLPQDIQLAAEFFVLVLFILAIIKVIRSLLPF